ncbi:hypothetical protein HZF02_32700 (plasmid) [Pseudomonas yamanorum]|nr:hypothetical protein HZF02_32700 [Pseudomonas yamanorum]
MSGHKRQKEHDTTCPQPGAGIQSGGWIALERPGQIQPGDHLSFIMSGKPLCVPAVLVLAPGTEREEIVYNRKQNHYFITSMALDGTSSHKAVHVRSGAAGGDQ